jgi:hypothetical protein
MHNGDYGNFKRDYKMRFIKNKNNVSLYMNFKAYFLSKAYFSLLQMPVLFSPVLV